MPLALKCVSTLGWDLAGLKLPSGPHDQSAVRRRARCGVCQSRAELGCLWAWKLTHVLMSAGSAGGRSHALAGAGSAKA